MPLQHLHIQLKIPQKYAMEFLHGGNLLVNSNHVQQKSSDSHKHGQRGIEYFWVYF